jgi:hypothetical protein
MQKTTTFKRFIEAYDSLGSLSIELWARQHLGRKVAKDFAVWISNEPANEEDDELPEHLIQVLLTYIGDDIHDHIASHIGVITSIRDVMKEKLQAAGLMEGTLDSLPIELFFKKELGLPTDEAEWATMWVQGETDWFDGDTDARDHIIDYVDENYSEESIFSMPQKSIEGYILGVLKQVAREKWDLEL